jgi:HD-GYP domain-containing protein (c-di-GMP phosphodiesterase class II)
MAEEGYSAEILPAEQLLQALQSLISMVKIYQANNQLVVSGINQLVKAAQVLLAGRDWVVVHLENGRFFINDEKLLRRKGAANILENFYTFLSDRRIPGFRIMPAVATASPEELTGFVQLLNSCGDQSEPAEWLEMRLLETGVGWISILQVDENIQARKEHPPEELEAPGRRYPKKIYAYTLRALRETAETIGEGKRFGMRKTGRMIQAMVEEISSQDSRMLVMSTVREYSDQIFFHSVNVAILAIQLGRELGVAKDALERLGTCALFHDLGKLTMPPEVLTRAGVLSEAEFALVQQHSLDSARLILQGMVAPVARKAAIMIPAFEHHLKADLSGYPALGWRKSPSLSGRIIAVADAYDALTSARVYRRKPMSGDRALGLMRVGGGNAFDPLVLKAFIRMLGVYPIGTLLDLGGGGTAMVSRSPLTDDLTRPRAVLLCSDDQGGVSRGEEVNLAERDATGEHRYRIVGSAHPSVRNIQPAQLLI